MDSAHGSQPRQLAMTSVARDAARLVGYAEKGSGAVIVLNRPERLDTLTERDAPFRDYGASKDR